MEFWFCRSSPKRLWRILKHSKNTKYFILQMKFKLYVFLLVLRWSLWDTFNVNDFLRGNNNLIYFAKKPLCFENVLLRRNIIISYRECDVRHNGWNMIILTLYKIVHTTNEWIFFTDAYAIKTLTKYNKINMIVGFSFYYKCYYE